MILMKLLLNTTQERNKKEIKILFHSVGAYKEYHWMK